MSEVSSVGLNTLGQTMGKSGEKRNVRGKERGMETGRERENGQFIAHVNHTLSSLTVNQ